MKILGFEITRARPVKSGGNNSFGIPPAWMNAYLGPGQPIQPLATDKNTEIPRTIDYPISVNAQLTPRTGYGLMPFQQLMLAYEKVPECRFPVNLIHRQLQAYQPRLVDKHGIEIEDHPFKWICEYPDGRTPFSVWMTRYLKSAKIYDAPALYIERSHEQITGLHFIDGSTLFVILDEYGRTPMPERVQDYVSRVSEITVYPTAPVEGSAKGPTSVDSFITNYNQRLYEGKDVPLKMPAYTQVIKGTPYAWWSADDIWYMPESRRVNSPYGEPFIEASWPWVMIILNLTAFELAHYRTGNMPEGYITLPREWLSTPDQLEALELAFNERMTRNPTTERNRLRLFPDGAKWFQTKRGEWPESLYNRARGVILDNIGIPPAEAGDIPGLGLGGKGFKEGNSTELNRNTINPNRLTILAPFNHMLRLSGVTDATMSLEPPMGEIDPDKLRSTVYEGMTHGTYSLNDGRSLLNMKPIGDPRDPENIANLHMIVAGSAIYVIEKMKLGEQGEAEPAFGGGKAGGEPANPEAPVEVEHVPEEDNKTLEQLMKSVEETGRLTNRFFSFAKESTLSKVKSTKDEIPQEEPLEKHCGVCDEDDAYLGAPISRAATIHFPKQDHVNGVEIVAMVPDGLAPKPALWKAEGGESEGLRSWIGGPLYLREAAAYEFDRALGFYLVPVTYVADSYGEQGAAVYYTMHNQAAKVAGQYAPEWIEKAGVFDYLIAQKDRNNRHNYFTHPDEPDRPILFDNGLTFPADGQAGYNSVFSSLVFGKELSPEVQYSLQKCLTDEGTWGRIQELVGFEAATAVRSRVEELLQYGWIVPSGNIWKAAPFEEDKHPRADDGKFAENPGGGGGDETDPAGRREKRKAPPKKPEARGPERKRSDVPHREKDFEPYSGVGGIGPGALDLPTDIKEKPKPGNKKGPQHENGGSYRRLRAKYPGNIEIHHMPADQASPLHENNGPAIPLPKAEHEITASYGNSASAIAYRQKQYDLIREGRFEEAQQMDIDDIREKFGNKYDKHIEEMRNYTASLKKDKHGMPKNPTPKQVRRGEA